MWILEQEVQPQLVGRGWRDKRARGTRSEVRRWKTIHKFACNEWKADLGTWPPPERCLTTSWNNTESSRGVRQQPPRVGISMLLQIKVFIVSCEQLTMDSVLPRIPKWQSTIEASLAIWCMAKTVCDRLWSIGYPRTAPPPGVGQIGTLGFKSWSLWTARVWV